ncbi:sulfite exporter TauE/SafE family protein [Candidatus Wolfebacteria bacterium]|nr:sulfite exporter TauE/SafE family protein [Candidatus Wolfebacteria bacterium]
MKKKSIGAILISTAILYFIITSFVIGHGIHPLNMLGAIILLVFGLVIMFKTDEEAVVTPKSSIIEGKEIDTATVAQSAQKLKFFFVSLAFGLLTAMIITLTYLTTSAGETLTTILSFAGGVSNIVLPCTLPLVFIIVPLSMGKGYKKGLMMALLFGLGLTIMLAIYGAGIALVGKYLGLDQATKILYIIAGIAAFIFGLSTLALISFKLPSYSKVPGFIQKQPDYFKALFLGFFLGNAGVGCPNPITYLILTAAAGTGSMAVGAWYMAINGLGRALPLIFLSVLGILGVNAAGGLMKHKITVDKITGWVLVAISMFIILNGIFGHLWYEGSVFHDGLNMAFGKLGGENIAEAEIPIEQFEQTIPYFQLGAWFNLLLPLLILVWYYFKKRGEMSKKTFWLLLLIFIAWGLLTMPFGFEMG